LIHASDGRAVTLCRLEGHRHSVEGHRHSVEGKGQVKILRIHEQESARY